MNKRESRFADFVLAQGPAGSEQMLADAEPSLPRSLSSLREGRSVISSQHLPVLASGLEFLLVAVVVLAAGYVYHDVFVGWFPHAELYIVAALSLAALFVGASGFAWDYSVNHLNDARAQIGRTLRRWNWAFALFVVALFMTQATEDYSRGSLVAQYAAGLLGAVAFRLLLTRFVAAGRASGFLGGKRLLLVGTHDLVSAMLRRLRRESSAAEVVGVLIIPRGEGGMAQVLTRAPEMARSSAPDDIVICMPWSDSWEIEALRDGFATVPSTVHLAPELESSWMHDPETARVGSMRTLKLARAPMSLRNRVLKRAFDMALASALLVAAAPVFLAIAVAIKLDSDGPVLFRQRRCGFNQKTFRVFKFRSMTTLDDGARIEQAQRGDSRVTRVGAFLRSTNLDELPQLLNVFLGQMSLVGPRPHALAHDSEYGERIRIYANRHKVKPGITGWAQVHGFRGATERLEHMRRRVEHDLHYIEHWSLMLDIKILILTLASPSSYRNAY